jgi:hypothetical protein
VRQLDYLIGKEIIWNRREGIKMGSKDLRDAQSDADEMIRNFLEEIKDQLLDSGEASDDALNDYTGGVSYHHEKHVDRSYTLLEAAELLDALGDYEVDDSGLWEGLSPREAISSQAAYTYGNAVYSLWQERIEEINSDDEIQEILGEYNIIEDPTDDQTSETSASLDARIISILGD